ncbi:MAG: KamA family radical SAM protein [Candidatus Omnitrophica bacterium]|nr:KamA family radical SAM protein [Candidatus Omnitrophota bacterium]
MSEIEGAESSLSSDDVLPSNSDIPLREHKSCILFPKNSSSLCMERERSVENEQLQELMPTGINFPSLEKNLLPNNPKKIETWRLEYHDTLKNIADLSNGFFISDTEKRKLREVIKKYHMRIPRYYLSLIQKFEDKNDPIYQQCVPSAAESENNSYMLTDPLNEEGTSPVSCLVHRYPDRVLLITTGRCFMYCRHCTRKRLWDEKIPETTLKDIEKAIEYISENANIREVIISGGDPLTMQTDRINHILKALNKIPHIKVIRIGTRTPVVFPQRINEKLCSMLEKYDNLWINVQFNHPREITPESTEAIRKLRRCGIPISNQSVLLKGINDSPEVMTELCHGLQQIGVRPYYLFQCDPVIGAFHFRTSVWKGVEIIEKMRGFTGGMCVPTFVIDGIDGKGKIPIGPNYVEAVKDGAIKLRNYNNETFWYYSSDEGDKIKSDKKSVSSIAIVFNLKKKNISNDAQADAQEEYDEIETIDALKAEIEDLGFNVIPVEQTPDFANIIRNQNIHFVLNIAEGIGVSRNRESQVPAILEMLGIPYSGSDPLALGITLDKVKTNQILKNANIPVPVQYVISAEEDIDSLYDIFNDERMFIVKPRWEGSSKGIFLNSVVNNLQDLRDRAAALLSRYVQPVVVEEYLEKEEITVGVCGNGADLQILGMMKISPRNKGQEKFIYSIENKRTWQTTIRYDGERSISPEIQALLKSYALKAFSALELRDIARIDFRVDKNNIPKIIDVNPLPGLSPSYGDLPILYSMNGGTHTELVKLLLQESFKRYGLAWV